MHDVVSIRPTEVRFCQAGIVNGIKQVGFTAPISSSKTVDCLMKIKGFLLVVFKVEKRYFVQEHPEDLLVKF